MPNWPRYLAHVFALVAAVFVGSGPGGAQPKLKWAHVYEISEPYHTEALWAAEEIKKRTNGRYEIGVFPASQLPCAGNLSNTITFDTKALAVLTVDNPLSDASRNKSSLM